MFFYKNGLQRRFDEAAKKGMHFNESKEDGYIERFDKLHRKLDHPHPRGKAFRRMRSIQLKLNHR